ncbi:MAG: DUF4908 domain-containing protein [Caulobacteraceae bacterium]|nr:DUF4908 domain-containing protein [Caulobacteraceae bacterium]
MASVSGLQRRGLGLAAALGLAGALGLPSHSDAAAPDWLRDAFAAHLGGHGKAPRAARYEIDSGGGFVLDRSTDHPLVRFDDNPEVWSLTVSRGPRGDLIYWNDLRQPLLRITKFGGVTLYTPRRPEGSAASMSGAAQPIRLRSVGVAGLAHALLEASARSSRAAQHLVIYEAPNANPGNDGLLADASLVASEAMAGLAARAGGRALMGRITHVYIHAGKEPAAWVREGVLLISVTPGQGLAGRPSSLRIQQALGAHTATVYVGLSP